MGEAKRGEERKRQGEGEGEGERAPQKVSCLIHSICGRAPSGVLT